MADELSDYLDEKFPKIPDESDEDFDPRLPGNQLNKAKADYERTHLSVGQKFKRLKAGKSWE